MKIMSVRLDEDLHAQLVARANQVGVPPSVLARAFIKASLDQGSDPVDPSFGGPRLNPSKDRSSGGPRLNPSKDRSPGGPKISKSKKRRRK